MGGCCCCCRSSDGDGGDNGRSEMEMKAKQTSKAMSIARNMSSPSIRINSNGDISGHGLALSGIALEQDHAYWEWHVRLPHKVHVDTMLFGVTTKKTSKFYKELQDKVQPEEGVSSDVNGTNYMRRIENLQNGDVVGVGMQQSDLPMIQFYLNGENLHDVAINRFRGTCYPGICLPESVNSDQDKNKLQVQFVMNDDEWQYKQQGSKFGSIIAARSIV